MRTLYLRIWLTVVAVLALFALVSGWLVQRHVEQQRARVEAAVQGRAEAWAELLQRSLPAADAPVEEQAAALRDWSQRLRLPLALDDPAGRRVAASESFLRREAEAPSGHRRALPIRLEDGRTLWITRGGAGRRGGAGSVATGGGGGPGPFMGPGPPREFTLERPLPGLPVLPGLPGLPAWLDGLSLLLLLGVLFLAIAAAAWPVVRRLTRRLEALKRGVETFGGGALHHRVPADGRDEVAAVAAAFNRAADQVQGLLRANQSLLANASHELRSPLARLKMAVTMLEEAEPAQRATLAREIHANIAELDALVDEVLLASRLDAQPDALRREAVDLRRLVEEESARTGARLTPQAAAQPPDGPVWVQADERLLRRACRNLLENARRYGGGDVEVGLERRPQGEQPGTMLRVSDRGPGVPEAWRERIFEPFFRAPGHAEHAGGVGLGLSLVRQIAQRHGGQARCEPREGGGSVFSLWLPG